MSRRLKDEVPPIAVTDAGERARASSPGAEVRFDALVRLNPGLRPIDILALWRLTGPSARLH